MTQFLAPDIFSITRVKPRPVARQYQIVWPCGTKWEYDRYDLDIPVFKNGEQTGVTNCYVTLAEAKADLEASGCVVRPYRREAT